MIKNIFIILILFVISFNTKVAYSATNYIESFYIAFIQDKNMYPDFRIRDEIIATLNSSPLKRKFNFYELIELREDDMYFLDMLNSDNESQTEALMQKLMQKDDLDLIVTLDVLSLKYLVKHNNHKTPVLYIGPYDPNLYNVDLASEANKNITVDMYTSSFTEKMKYFMQIKPFRKLGVLFTDNEVGRVLARVEDLKKTSEELDFEYALEPVESGAGLNDCRSALSHLLGAGIDSLFVNDLSCFNDNNKDLWRLLEPLSLLGIPTFTEEQDLVKHGVLAGLSYDLSFGLVDLVKKIYDILYGKHENYSQVSEQKDYNISLSLNIDVAVRSAYVPSYKVLAFADHYYYNIDR